MLKNGFLIIGMILFIHRAVANAMFPLHAAILQGNVAKITKLLDKTTTNVDEQNSYGNTPLHLAVLGGNLEMVMLLLRHHALVVKKNDAGLTPLALVKSMLTNHHEKPTPAHYFFNESATAFDRLIVIDLNLSQWELRHKNMRIAQFIICSALHPRVGAASPLQSLGKFAIDKIAQSLQTADFPAILPNQPSWLANLVLACDKLFKLMCLPHGFY